MRSPIAILIFACVTLTFTEPSFAYLGPGIGAGAITVVLGFIASILLAVFAILWYPLKRVIRRRKVKVAVKKVEGP